MVPQGPLHVCGASHMQKHFHTHYVLIDKHVAVTPHEAGTHWAGQVMRRGTEVRGSERQPWHWWH